MNWELATVGWFCMSVLCFWIGLYVGIRTERRYWQALGPGPGEIVYKLTAEQTDTTGIISVPPPEKDDDHG